MKEIQDAVGTWTTHAGFSAFSAKRTVQRGGIFISEFVLVGTENMGISLPQEVGVFILSLTAPFVLYGMNNVPAVQE